LIALLLLVARIGGSLNAQRAVWVDAIQQDPNDSRQESRSSGGEEV